MMRTLLALAITTAASLASAQTTYIVDTTGGGDFTDLPAALTVATHGDVLLVRAGTYTPVSTDQGVRILGDVGAELAGGRMTVHDLPATERFAMRRFTPATGGTCTVEVRDCDGPVHFEDVNGSTTPTGSGFLLLEAIASGALSCTECNFGPGDPGIRVTGANTHLTLLQCNSQGAAGQAAFPFSAGGKPGLVAHSGFVRAQNCGFFGGWGSGRSGSGGDAIIVDGTSQLWIGQTVTALGGFGGSPFSGGSNGAPLVRRGGSQVRIDPDNALLARFASEVAVVPTVTAASIDVGGTIRPTWSGGLGQTSILVISLAAPTVVLPWGPFHLDPATTGVVYAGPATARPTPFTLFPNIPAGTLVTLQGLVDLGNELVLTNPLTLVTR